MANDIAKLTKYSVSEKYRDNTIGKIATNPNPKDFIAVGLII